MDIKIIFEDDCMVVLDKPGGILVHPTLAHEKNTLVDWLIKHEPGIDKLKWPDKTRIGIVHRLDKDTSGLIILAKNPEILNILQNQFKERKINKTYTALVLGIFEKNSGTIEAAITRGDNGLQKIRETKYSFSENKIRPAITDYEVLQGYEYDSNHLTLVEAMPKTGRMHQIRVHLKYIEHPIIGDPLYNTKQSRNLSNKLKLNRQFLHASSLEFLHPISNKELKYKSEIPNELQDILNNIKKVGENEQR